MAILGGGAVSYERGTPEERQDFLYTGEGVAHIVDSGRFQEKLCLQGYLAHKKYPHPRTLQ